MESQSSFVCAEEDLFL
jgi:hypothetical protein